MINSTENVPKEIEDVAYAEFIVYETTPLLEKKIKTQEHYRSIRKFPTLML